MLKTTNGTSHVKCEPDMDKSYEILSQDKVFESNIILDYDHQSYEVTLENEPDNSESKCARPSDAASDDPINFARKSGLGTDRSITDSSKRSSRKDVLLGSVSVEEYNHVCPISPNGSNKDKSAPEVSISNLEGQHSQTDTKLHLNTTVDIERHGEEVNGSPCSNDLRNDVMEGGHIDVEAGRPTVVNYASDSSIKNLTQDDDEDCFIKSSHLSVVEVQEKDHGHDKDTQFKVKHMETDGEINVDTVDAHQEGSQLEDNEPNTVLATTDVSVGSNLQFLNTGDSIVVLTQDSSNIGLSNNMVSFAVFQGPVYMKEIALAIRG